MKIKKKILFWLWETSMRVQVWAFRKLIVIALGEAGLTIEEVIRSISERRGVIK